MTDPKSEVPPSPEQPLPGNPGDEPSLEVPPSQEVASGSGAARVVEPTPTEPADDMQLEGDAPPDAQTWEQRDREGSPPKRKGSDHKGSGKGQYRLERQTEAQQRVDDYVLNRQRWRPGKKARGGEAGCSQGRRRRRPLGDKLKPGGARPGAFFQTCSSCCS